VGDTRRTSGIEKNMKGSTPLDEEKAECVISRERKLQGTLSTDELKRDRRWVGRSDVLFSGDWKS